VVERSDTTGFDSCHVCTLEGCQLAADESPQRLKAAGGLQMGRLPENEARVFPDDENGDVLRRMFASGDNLLEPRVIDFSFTFIERSQALAFADAVNTQEFKVGISYYEERGGWQVVVKKKMVPTHEDITALERLLTDRAKSVGGEADGWGCMQVDH